MSTLAKHLSKHNVDRKTGRQTPPVPQCCCSSMTDHLLRLGTARVIETNAWKPDIYVRKYKCGDCGFEFEY